jgi:hypothetical protein
MPMPTCEGEKEGNMKNVLFEELKDSLARAFARVGALASIYQTTATERVVSFITKRNLEAEVRWFDDECSTEEGEKAVEIKVIVGGYTIMMNTVRVNERFLINIEGVTDPKTPIEIFYTLNGISNIWYHNITREELPGEVCKFLDDILEVI